MDLRHQLISQVTLQAHKTSGREKETISSNEGFVGDSDQRVIGFYGYPVHPLQKGILGSSQGSTLNIEKTLGTRLRFVSLLKLASILRNSVFPP